MGYFAWQSVWATSWVARLAPTSRYERAVAAQAPRTNDVTAETTTIFLMDLGDSWRRSSAGTVLYKAIAACDGRLCPRSCRGRENSENSQENSEARSEARKKDYRRISQCIGRRAVRVRVSQVYIWCVVNELKPMDRASC